MYKAGQKVVCKKQVIGSMRKNEWLTVISSNSVYWMDEELQELTVEDDIGNQFTIFADLVAEAE